MAIRYHLDEHLGYAIAAALRAKGIDVSMSHEVRLAGLHDSQQLQFALEESRVLVTHDHDFLRLASQGTRHAGIAYCRHGTRTPREIIDALVLLHACYDSVDMLNRVEYL
jgi:predicted nuclease of predicted toxin-antitoxin system